MPSKTLIENNPLNYLADQDNKLLAAGSFGAVVARAGVGKTALLVQLALYVLLRGKKILHISLNDPIQKVALWYDEVLKDVAEQLQLPSIDPLMTELYPHRFIMTFKTEGFTVPKLQERLTDLSAQDIFAPDMILLDGIKFEQVESELLHQLKQCASQQQLPIWFTVRSHRDSNADELGLPDYLQEFVEYFETALQLNPKNDRVHVQVLKGKLQELENTPLYLDPKTMLLYNKS